jgi:uncharacterized protein (DUF58 family)
MPFHINRQQIERYSTLELLARQVVEGFITGLHKSPFHGFSVEFAEHRLYNNGESTRHIDWKLYGRTDKLFVKRYEEETNLRCQIVLDVSSSMHYPAIKEFSLEQQNKISFSVIAAAALINILKKQRDAVGVSCFNDKLVVQSEMRSSEIHMNHLFNLLSSQIQSTTSTSHKTQVAQILHQLANTIHRRSLVIVFSDLMEEQLDMDQFFDSLRHLRHNKHEVIVFHVHDKNTEFDFGFEQRPHRFVDLETGMEVKLQPNEVRSAYRKYMSNFEQTVKLKCTQYNIDFVSTDIEKGFNQILFPFLNKRRKLF